MKRLLTVLTLTLLISVQLPETIFAQIPPEEIEQYLSPIGWDVTDLENYLNDYYDRSIDSFSSLEELKEWVGTPITEENRQAVLDSYNMSLQDLEILLTEFGESPADYYFVEDLDNAIDFYLNFNDDMAEVTDFFGLLGISDAELERMFIHLSKLNEQEVEQQLTLIESRILALDTFTEAAELTEAQKEEIASIFTDMLSAYNLSAVFYLESQGQREQMTLRSLLDMATLNGSVLIIELYDEEDNLLLDIVIDEDLFDTDFLSQLAEDLLLLPHLANEHPIAQKMPNTASPYVNNMLIGLMISLFSIALYIRLRKRREKYVS